MSNHCLNMKAAFGFSHDLGGAVHSLFDESREAILFPSSHTLIYHDCRTGIYQFLQGHANEISAVAVSNDKHWAVSADYGGEESLIIVWDCKTLLPVRTYTNLFGPGVLRLDLSDDGAVIACLTGRADNFQQKLLLFEWANPSEDPIVEALIPFKFGLQRDVRFNPADYRELVTNSAFKTIFWSWVELLGDKTVSQQLQWYAPDVSQGDFKVLPSAFTVSCFLPGTTAALTGTVAGEVVLYDVSGRAFSKNQHAKGRIPVKLLVLHTSSGSSRPIMPADEINQKNEGLLLEKWHVDGRVQSHYMVPGPSYFSLAQQPEASQIQTYFYCYLTQAAQESQQMTGGATQSFNQAITYMHAKADGFVVTGGLDGAVRMFDFRLRLLSWYENLESGPITSISIVMPQTSQAALEQIDMSTAAVYLLPGYTPREFYSKSEAINAKFGSVILRDFLCATARGAIILVPAAVFEFIQPEKRRGTMLYQGIPGQTTCFYAPKAMDDLPLQQTFNPKTQASNPLVWLANDRGDLVIYDFTSNKILRSNNIVGDILNTGNVKNRLTGTLAQRHAEGYEQASYLLPENPIAPIFVQSYPHVTSIALFCDLVYKPVLLCGTSFGSALLLDPFTLKVLQSFRNVARTRRIVNRINGKDYVIDDSPYAVRHVRFSKEGDIIAIVDESSQLKLLSKTTVQDQKMNYMTGKTDYIITDNNNAENQEFNEIFNDNSVEALRSPPHFVSDVQEREEQAEEVEKRTETDVRIHPAAQLARANQKKRDAASSAGQWDPLGHNLMVCKDQLNSVFFCDFLPFKLFNEIDNLPSASQQRDPLVILSKDRFYTIIDIDATLASASKIIVYNRFRTDMQATPTAMCFLRRPKYYLDQLKDQDFEQMIKEIEAEPDDLKREVKKSLLSLQSENKGYLNATIRPELQPIDQRDLIVIANNQYKLYIREPKRLPGNYEISNNTIFTQQQYTANPVLWSHYQGGYTTNQPAFTLDKFSTNSSYYVNPRLAGSFPLRKTILGPTFAGHVNQLLPIDNNFSDPKNDINSQESVDKLTDSGETEKKFRYRTEYEVLSQVGSVKHIPQYIVFQTPEKVIGLIRTPLDGAPHRYIGVIAHAGEMLSTQVTFCIYQDKYAGNTFTITAGKTDSCLFLWGVDYSQMDILVDSQIETGLMESDPFLQQLEDGATGDYYQEIQEYFSYAQIFDSEAKGLSPSENARAPVNMIPDMLRALGVYISNEHINNAVTEIVEEETRKMRLQSFLQTVKQAVREQKQVAIIDTREGAPAFYSNCEGIYIFFKDYLTKNYTILIQEDNNDQIEVHEQFDMTLWDVVGNNELTLSLQDFIRILVNYRLVAPQSYEEIAMAFEALAGQGNTVIDRPGLVNKLYQLGEVFNAGELQDALGLITGKQVKNGVMNIQQLLPDYISLNDLACGLLRFPMPGSSDKAY